MWVFFLLFYCVHFSSNKCQVLDSEIIESESGFLTWFDPWKTQSAERFHKATNCRPNLNSIQMNGSSYNFRENAMGRYLKCWSAALFSSSHNVLKRLLSQRQ